MNNRLFVGITLTFLAISVIALLSAGWNDGVMTGWGMMAGSNINWSLAFWKLIFVLFAAALVLWVAWNWKR